MLETPLPKQADQASVGGCVLALLPESCVNQKRTAVRTQFNVPPRPFASRSNSGEPAAISCFRLYPWMANFLSQGPSFLTTQEPISRTFRTKDLQPGRGMEAFSLRRSGFSFPFLSGHFISPLAKIPVLAGCRAHLLLSGKPLLVQWMAQKKESRKR